MPPTNQNTIIMEIRCKAKVGEHTFALRNIEVYEKMSEETIAFHAYMEIDGKIVGHAKNDGQGGCNVFHVSPDAPKDTIGVMAEMEDELRKHVFCLGYPYTIKWAYSLDFLATELVSRAYKDKKKTYILP